MTHQTMYRNFDSLHRNLLVGVASLTLAACGDAEHASPEGKYSLVRTGAGELPALLGTNEGCRYEAVGGSVEMRSENKYDAVLLRRRHACSSGLPDTVFRDSGSGTFRVERDSVFFRFTGGASAGEGVLRGDSLVVQGPGQTLHYRRAAGQ